MPNRLAQESSPYLLQHAENPVDWLPWGDEAFSRARNEAKPIFLSVGYSSCHWCHVMAHESFEDLEVASLLNRGFVSIKVDREERPDVDEAYMTAVQLQSGRGGWPMSAFLTPEKAPFFAGTYFPRPSFLELLRQVEAAWSTNRDQVMASATELREAVESAQSRPAPMSGRKLDQAFLVGALKAIAEDFDPRHGGFGAAPKFPPHGTLLFLNAVRQSREFGNLCHTAETMFQATLQRMVRGGIHDHVGGGFHRYSTDSQWLLPHFEKMLYDNVLMLLHLSSAADVPEFAAASKGIVRWLKDEMLTDDGLLGTALDADSDGEEGKFYVWTMDELRAVLGTRAESFATAYRFEPEGNYRDEATHDKSGANIPHLSLDTPWEFEVELGLLRQARAERPRPLFDHKALLGLNGLAVAALAQTGERDFAESIFERLVAFVKHGGPSPRQITAGHVSGLGFLEDYAGLLLAYATLERGTLDEFESRFGSRAAFRDPKSGDFFNTTSEHEGLLGRTKPVFDQPVPSANAVMSLALNRLGQREEARKIVEANLGWIERAPGSTGALLLAGLESMPS